MKKWVKYKIIIKLVIVNFMDCPKSREGFNQEVPIMASIVTKVKAASFVKFKWLGGVIDGVSLGFHSLLPSVVLWLF